jgi:hypothetical protein
MFLHLISTPSSLCRVVDDEMAFCSEALLKSYIMSTIATLFCAALPKTLFTLTRNRLPTISSGAGLNDELM